MNAQGRWHFKKHSPVRARYNATRVASIAAGSFFEQLLASSSFVAMKIDVEGFERAHGLQTKCPRYAHRVPHGFLPLAP